MNGPNNLRNALRKTKLWLRHSSPTILSCAASVGVVATTVLAVKATPKALKLIKEEENDNELTKLEIIKIAAPAYLPTILVGFSTITCVFSANLLNKRQQVALVGAYTMVNNAYKDYKHKVKEIYGEEAHRKIKESIAIEKCENVHISAPSILKNSSLDFDESNQEEIRLFYDSISQRYFESTVESVIKAEYHLNRNFCLNGGYVSLNDFYDLLGLKSVDYGDTVGWYVQDGLYWIDFDHQKTIIDGDLECLIIDVLFEPTADFLNNI